MSRPISYPNMQIEVFDAIHEYFKDDPDIEADCYLYLKSLLNNEKRIKELSYESENKINKMNRCPYCGELLESYHYKEYHYELDDVQTEDRYESYCPNCDLPGQLSLY